MSTFFVPPGGFMGFSQMTPATRAGLSPSRSSGSPRRRRRRKASKTPRRAKRASGRKIKFGSPAWRKKYGLGKKKRK